MRLGVAPELWGDFRNNPFKGLHLMLLKSSSLSSKDCRSIGCTGVAPELWVDFRNNPFKGLHLMLLKSAFWLQGTIDLLGVAPKLQVDFRNNPFKGLHLMLLKSAFYLQGTVDLLGAPKVHPMGVAPNLWVDFRNNPFKCLHLMLLKSVFSEYPDDAICPCLVRSEINLIGDRLDVWLVEADDSQLDITLLCASMLLLIRHML
jgi:thymidine kinase